MVELASMADDDEDEAEEPAVELDDASPVDGAPLARVAARLTWGMEHSEVVRKEGDTEIRTADGPRTLESVMADVDAPYFETRQDFVAAVRDVAGVGPVPTED